MSPLYLNPPPNSSPIPFLEFKGDQLLGQVHHDLGSSSSFSFSTLDNSRSYFDESLALEHSRHPQEIKVDMGLSHDKPHDLRQLLQSSSWTHQNLEDGSGCSYGYSSNNPRDHLEKPESITNNDQKYSSRKWKPSKVRIMQKMLATSKNSGEQKLRHVLVQNTSRNNNNGVRVCSDCHTTSTPLWRSGPQGPKSLCNACGIRQRKARRAAMAAAAAAAEYPKDDQTVPSISMESPKPNNKGPSPQEDMITRDREFDNKTHHLPLKKRGKTIDMSMNYINNNNDPQSNNNGSSFSSNKKDYISAATSQRVFPRDEEEGAILLMALSCGLACSSY